MSDEKCAYCGLTGDLINHHISYEPEITVRICRSCHGIEHQRIPSPKLKVSPQLFEFLKQMHPIVTDAYGNIIYDGRAFVLKHYKISEDPVI